VLFLQACLVNVMLILQQVRLLMLCANTDEGTAYHSLQADKEKKW